MPTPEEQEKQKFRDQLEAEGKAEVWRRAGVGFYWRPRHAAWATEWLREQEKAEAAAVVASRRENLVMVLLAIIAILVAFLAR
jgi:hypothetical protein